MKKRFFLFIISFAILGALLYFSDTGKTLEVIANANFFLLSGIFSLWFLDSSLRTLRWQVLLRRIDIKIKFFKLWPIFVSSMFISNLSPAKTGDPIRSVILKRTENESFSRSLSSIIIERIMDVFFLVIVALVSMFFLFTSLSGIGTWLYLSIILYVIVVVFGLVVVSSEKRSKIFFTGLFRFFSFIPKVKSYEKKVKRGSKKLHFAFKKYKHLPTLLTSFLLTAMIWTLQGIVMFLCFKSIGLNVYPWACLAVIPLSVLIGILTFLPGALGSSEVITVTFFTTLFAISISQVTAVTLIGRFLLFWPYIIIGAILFSLKFK